MIYPLTLPIDCIMKWDGHEVTDHGRAELQVSTSKIMNEARMVDGTLRRYVVAEKRTWSTSWDMLMSKDTGAVDGFWSGESMLNFYKTTRGEFQLTLTMGDGTTEMILVMFSDFQHSVMKRSDGPNGDLWAVNVELVEV